MSPLFRSLCLLLLVCIGLAGLSACADRTSDGADTIASGDASAADIAKYNAYVKASNDMGSITSTQASFAGVHDELTSVLEGEQSLGVLRWRHFYVKRLQDNLEAAIALRGTVPALDDAANTLLQTVQALQTPSAALEYDLDTKGYQDDDGAKSRELIGQLLPLLAEAAEAQQVFERALEQEDQALLQREMEQTEEGSLRRYTITAVYYGKRLSAGLSEAFEAKLEQQDIQPLLEPIRADIAAFDANAQGYVAYMAEHKRLPGDDCMGFALKELLSGARNMLEELQKPEPARPSTSYHPDPRMQRQQQAMLQNWERNTRNREISNFRLYVEQPFNKLIQDYNLRCN